MNSLMSALHISVPPRDRTDPALPVAAELVRALHPYGIHADVHLGDPVLVSVGEGLVVAVRAGGLTWRSPDLSRGRLLQRVRYTARAAVAQLVADHDVLVRRRQLASAVEPRPE
jgi:hypothetical protein